MDNSIYITLSRQLALFRDMEATANNVANMNTTGYQSENLIFDTYLVKDENKSTMAFANDISTYHDTSQGSLKVTSNPLDLAIGSDGYFTVETPLGTRYTRAGNFQLSNDGSLVTAEGYAVLDNGGQRIQFNQEDTNIIVGEDGTVSVDGEIRGAIGVVSFENPQLLRRRGDRLYEAPEGVTGFTPEMAMVYQGTLEQSNVVPVREMTHMVEVSRAVGSTAKFIETMYDLQRRNTTTWTQQT